MMTNITHICVFMALLLMAISCNSEADRVYNLVGFKKYQTFNEYTMKADGVAKRAPFVYVHSSGNRIIVASSDKLRKLAAYTYHPDAKYWSSIIVNTDGVDSIYRFFYNDTIIEQRIGYCSVPDSSYEEHRVKLFIKIYMKTKHNCVSIRPDTVNDYYDTNRFVKLRDLCRNYKKRCRDLSKIDDRIYDGDEGYLDFEKIISGDSMIYCSRVKKGLILEKFPFGSLGEWGTGPGFSGSEKSWEYNEEASYTREGAYYDWPRLKHYVDVSPVPANGNVTYKDGCETRMLKNKWLKGKEYIVDLMIDERGQVLKAELRSSGGNEAQEQWVLKMARRFRYRRPAMRDGEAVKCWHWVLLEFTE